MQTYQSQHTSELFVSCSVACRHQWCCWHWKHAQTHDFSNDVNSNCETVAMKKKTTILSATGGLCGVFRIINLCELVARCLKAYLITSHSLNWNECIGFTDIIQSSSVHLVRYERFFMQLECPSRFLVHTTTTMHWSSKCWHLSSIILSTRYNPTVKKVKIGLYDKLNKFSIYCLCNVTIRPRVCSLVRTQCWWVLSPVTEQSTNPVHVHSTCCIKCSNPPLNSILWDNALLLKKILLLVYMVQKCNLLAIIVLKRGIITLLKFV